MTRRRIAFAVGAFCWLAIFAGVALVALDPGRGWIGVTVIAGSLVTSLAVLPRLRHQEPAGDDGDAPADRSECPYCDHGDGGTP